MNQNKIAIPRTVWTLGFVSLFMDLSSELIHSILPIYLVSVMGASAFSVGLIEGIAEATAQIVKIFSGIISDYFSKRKLLILGGYGIAAITKPLFPLANSIDTVFYARVLDRIGKGVRGSPRDALIADVSPPSIRGACFGLRQSMDTVGAFLGPLCAMLFLFYFHNDIRHVLWFAVFPAFIAVMLILLGVEEPTHKNLRDKTKTPIDWLIIKDFTKPYWWVVSIGAIFTLARFSEAFLVLRGQTLNLDIVWMPMVMVVMSLVYSISAYPVGKLSDRINKKNLLFIGLLFLIIADILLAKANSLILFFFGIGFWGLHMGFSQGILATMVAETTPPELKGTAFGLFNLITGSMMLLASVIAGWLWQQFGFAVAFYYGALFASLAAISLPLYAVYKKRIKCA